MGAALEKKGEAEELINTIAKLEEMVAAVRAKAQQSGGPTNPMVSALSLVQGESMDSLAASLAMALPELSVPADGTDLEMLSSSIEEGLQKKSKIKSKGRARR